MGNFLKDLTAKYNLAADRLQAWGFIGRYWFQLEPPVYHRKFLTVRTAVCLPDDETAAVVASGMADIANGIPALRYTKTGGSMTLVWNAPFGGFKTDAVDGLLLRLTALFQSAGATPACFSCNSGQTDSFAMENGVAVRLCTQCQADIEKSIEERNNEYSAAKNNFLIGFAGAAIGALAGSVVWVVIGLLGYFAAIAGAAISFCAVKGYTMMKGKVTVPAILMICLISLVVLVIAQFVTLDINAYMEFQKAGAQISFWQVFQHTFEIPFLDSELTTGFVKDIVLGLLFMALGSYPIIKMLYAKAAAPGGRFKRL